MDHQDQWSEHIRFSYLCDFFEKSLCKKENKVNKEKKLEKLENFFSKCREICPKECDLFPVLRLLVPKLDQERGSYSIKETVFAKLFIDLLKIGANSEDAIRLKNYKAPQSSAINEANDFAAVLYEVLKDRSYERTPINIRQINDKLNKIVTLNAQKQAVNEILLGMFKEMDAVMVKWLVRIILKDLKFGGIGHKVILDAFHKDANEYFDTNSNLRKLCSTLKDPSKRMNEIEISLFTAFRPMLAENVQLDHIEKQMKHRSFYIEVKYDGERMLAHRESNGNFKFFSRNLNDFTEEFGRHSGSGKFSQYIQLALSSEVDSVILDGEICTFNKELGVVVTKAQHDNIRKLRDDHPTLQQCLVVYDVVYYNGDVLTMKPLNERLKILKKIIPKEIPGRIYYAESKLAENKADVIEALNNAIDMKDEGIMIKRPDSVYKPGGRNNAGWIKVKPEYQDNLTDTCDVIILGGYYSETKRLKKGTLSHFLCGIKHGSIFRSFCRVKSGFSDKELGDLHKKLQPYFKEKFLSNVKYGKDKPDLKIDPKNSVVLEIRAAEIIESKYYDTGCTLRFPRVERIREDKNWSDCMTFEDLEKLKSKGKLAKRHLENEEQQPKKRKTVSTNKPMASLNPMYQPSAKLNDIKITSNELDGEIFVVEPDYRDSTLKPKLEEIIRRHSGIVEQNVGDYTSVLIQTKGSILVKNAIKVEACDVIDYKWLLNCDKGQFHAARPCDMIFSTKSKLEQFEKYYDEFGDSFTIPATIDSLEYSMKQVRENGKTLKNLKKAEEDIIADFEEEHNIKTKFGLFRPLKAFFHEGRGFSSLTFQFYGGDVKQNFNDGISYYFVPSDFNIEEDLDDIKANRREFNQGLKRSTFKILKDKWIKDSLEKESLISEKDYEL